MSAAAAEIEIVSPDALWAWLSVNHTQAESAWLLTYKKRVAEKYVSREQILDALVAFGWIDGRRMAVDADRTKQLIAPRKVEHWAQSYRNRAEKLERDGRMQPAGRASVNAGKASGLWDFMADVDALITPDDLQFELDAAPPAAAWWRDAASSYRRNALRWLKRAKTETTRRNRIDAIAAAAAHGEKLPQM